MKPNSIPSAGTEDAISTNADATTSSQTIAKPLVGGGTVDFIKNFDCSIYDINEDFEDFEDDYKAVLINEYSETPLCKQVHGGFKDLAEYLSFKIDYRFQFLAKLKMLTTLNDGFNGNKKIIASMIETRQNFQHFLKEDIVKLIQNIGEAAKLIYVCKRDYFNSPTLEKYELVAHKVVYQLYSTLSFQNGSFISLSDKILKLKER